MAFCVTSALERIQAMLHRICVVQGGTSAGKTVAILLIILDYALENDNKVVTVVTDTFPNLRTGAMRDWLKICAETNVDKVTTWNKSDHIMTFPNGTIVEFYSVDTMGALGARRDVLFVNEANRIAWDTFSNLEIRTKEKVYVDYNPTAEFWAHTELVKQNKCDFIKLTYKDNEALDDQILSAIESRKGDGTSNWWRVFGLGEVGSLEGNVYAGWTPSERQDGDKLIRYGLDFGFSNDETACVAVYERAGGLFVEERLYKTGLVSGQVVSAMQGIVAESGDAIIVCDSARPEIIADMKRNGLMAIPCNKGAGSVLAGIDAVSSYQIWYSGKNLEKEFLTYAWKKRKDGTILDAPQDGQDHLLDALRYAIYDIKKPPVFDWS